MDLSSGWASTPLVYHQQGQIHDVYQQSLSQHHDAYLHAPPAPHHDPYRNVPAVQQYDLYQNAPLHHQSASHYHGSSSLQQQLSYGHSSYEYHHDPPPSRYASSQSHYQAIVTAADPHYLSSAYASDRVPGATAADVGSYSSYPALVAGAQTLSVKDAIRQFGTDPNAYSVSALHAQPHSLMGVAALSYTMGRTDTNLPGPYTFKTAMKKKAKGPMTVKSQVAYCQVCKVECNTEEMLKKHKAGKKHKKNLETLKESISMKPSKPPSVIAAQPKPSPSGNVAQPSKNGSAAANPGTAKSKKKKTASENEDLETKKRKVLEGGAPEDGVKTCSLCNVVCNSPVVFKSHLEGQKHKAMVQKQQEGNTQLAK